MCDGTYQYPTKSSAATILQQPLLIVCGNASIKSVYPKAHTWVSARFIEVNVDPPDVVEAKAKLTSAIEASSKCKVTLPKARAQELVAQHERTMKCQMSLTELVKYRKEQDLKRQ